MMTSKLIAAFAAIVLAIAAAPAVAQVTPPAVETTVPPEVLAIQESLAAACAVNPAGALINVEACLSAIAAALQQAALLPVTMHGAIGILIGDIMERSPEIADQVAALVLAAGLPAVSAGVSVGLSTPGPTNPMSMSPA